MEETAETGGLWKELDAEAVSEREPLARLQTDGIDISAPALSLLEGQKRPVFDYELAALSDCLGVSVHWLLGREEEA